MLIKNTDFKRIGLSELTAVVHGGAIFLVNLNLCIYNQETFQNIILDGDIINKKSSSRFLFIYFNFVHVILLV